MTQPPPTDKAPDAEEPGGETPDRGAALDPDFTVPPEYFVDGSVPMEPESEVPPPPPELPPLPPPIPVPAVRDGSATGLLILRVLAGVALVALICWGITSCDDPVEYDENGFALSETEVPAPTTVDANEVVTQLAAAERAQEVCYGWHLTAASGGTVSVGSNLGVGQRVSGGTECARWAEIAVNVVYTPESSESEDSVTVDVRTSGNLGSGYLESLARLGLTDSRFLDDPADSTLRAALALPLLVAESGRAGPVPTPSTTPAAGEPLPEASSDFWRANSTGMWVAIIAIVIGVWLALYGFFVGRRNRAEDLVRAARAAAAARRKAYSGSKKKVNRRR